MFINDFLGTYFVNLDDKKRFSFPAEFRSVLKNKKIIITKGLDGCLYVFTEKRYVDFCERQLSSNEGIEKRAFRQLRRFLTASAIKKKIDAQGRLLLPQSLAAVIDIEKELVVIGAGDRIELWNKSKWEQEQKSFSDLEDILEKI